MPWRVVHPDVGCIYDALLQMCNLAEIIVRTYKHFSREMRLARGLRRKHYAGLLLMVWILKREVRAFGGCLGMYRR